MTAPRRTAPAILALLVVLGALLRLFDLGNRPLHGDEAVGAVLSADVRDTGSFVYESANRHGPYQYFRGGAVMALLGESASAIRLPYAVAGCLLPLVLLGFRRHLGDPGSIVAVGLAAFSPAFVYFSRDAIQEIDFVLATACLLGAGFRFAGGGRAGSLVAAILSAGWMVTIKESFLVVWGCLALALLAGAALGGAGFRAVLAEAFRSLRRRAFAAGGALVAAALLAGAAYTNGFRDGDGLRNLASNLREMLGAGAASRDAALLHAHPARFYLTILLHYEWATVALALPGLWLAFRTRRPFSLFLALYAVLIGAIHFVLPYKTPWLLLTPLLPLMILAGDAAGRFLALPIVSRRSWFAPAVAVLIPLLSLPRTVTLGFARPADPAEPMVYHQAGVEQVRLAEEIRRLLPGIPPDAHPKVLICLPYVWPLAWYLKDEADIVYERGTSPSESMASAQVPIVVTLESGDSAFLRSFTGGTSVPPLTLPGYRSRRVVLIPPEYMVGRIWLRTDLAPP